MANWWYIEDDVLYLLEETVSEGRIHGLIENLMNSCQYLYDGYFSDGHFDDSIEGYEDAVADIEYYANKVGEELECTLVCLEDDLGLLTWYVEETGDKVVWFNGDYVEMVSVELYGNDDDEPTTLAKWSWEKLNGLYTKNVETVKKAYKALCGEVNEETGLHYEPEDFSFRVWNDLCAKAKALMDALSKSWNGTYLEYEATLMSEADRVLTDKRFNSLRCNIDKDAVPDAEGLADVHGGYIIALTTRLNDLIDYYTK